MNEQLDRQPPRVVGITDRALDGSVGVRHAPLGRHAVGTIRVAGRHACGVGHDHRQVTVVVVHARRTTVLDDPDRVAVHAVLDVDREPLGAAYARDEPVRATGEQRRGARAVGDRAGAPPLVVLEAGDRPLAVGDPADEAELVVLVFGPVSPAIDVDADRARRRLARRHALVPVARPVRVIDPNQVAEAVVGVAGRLTRAIGRAKRPASRVAGPSLHGPVRVTGYESVAGFVELVVGRSAVGGARGDEASLRIVGERRLVPGRVDDARRQVAFVVLVDGRDPARVRVDGPARAVEVEVLGSAGLVGDGDRSPPAAHQSVREGALAPVRVDERGHPWRARLAVVRVGGLRARRVDDADEPPALVVPVPQVQVAGGVDRADSPGTVA